MPQRSSGTGFGEQTMLTHRSKVAEESAVFLAKSGCQLIHGANLLETLHEKAPQWALKKQTACSQKTQWTRFPNLAQPVRFHPPSPRHSVWQSNTAMTPKLLSFRIAMAGGYNCARGLALGMILGAANWQSSLPAC